MVVVLEPDILVEDIPVITELEQVFIDAEQVLRDKGHTKRRLSNSRGNVCALGALNTVIYGSPYRSHQMFNPAANLLRHNARHALYNVIGGDHLANWNDLPERTADDVINAFRKARKLAACQ